jgi:hypothetical protein
MRDAQYDIAAIAAVREEFLKNKTESVFYRETPNLIDEVPIFSEDTSYDSTDHVLIADLGPPTRFMYRNHKSELLVSVSLPEGVTLDDPEHVYNALLKLHSRIAYYTNSS